jgi:microcystin-dependent protein
MAKNKVSEWSATPADNTDVGGIDINEGCAPSGINNAIRDVMAQIKDMQTGADGDNFVVSGTLAITGGFTLDSAAGTAGQVMVSAGAGNTPTWGNAFVAGMIMLWSGSIASIPSGWLLCDGSNSTPDLRSRFVVGAGSTYSVGVTGGSANAIVVSHTHTITDPGHLHSIDTDQGNNITPSNYISTLTNNNAGTVTTRNSNTATTGITIDSSGSSGTNANLPPYFALAYIMKA